MSIKQTVLTYIAIYFAGINIAGFISMALDKQKARRNAWRIPEATLILFALFGGSLGSLLGMSMFHHKTKKPKFYIGIPIILAIQIIVILYFFLFSGIDLRVL